MRNLFKKETEEDKIRAEINNTEFKKNSMLTTVNNEKMGLEQQKRDIIYKIGEEKLREYKEKIEDFDYKSSFDSIDQLEGQMQEKDAKMQDISARYDEEISLLSANLATAQAAAQQAQMQQQMPPMQQGGQYVQPGVVMQPGQMIQNNQVMQSGQGMADPGAMAAPGAVAVANAGFCECCGKGYVATDLFCQGCGFKLAK